MSTEEKYEYFGWSPYIVIEDGYSTYIKNNNKWAIVVREDGVILLYEVVNSQYVFTGFKYVNIEDIEKEIDRIEKLNTPKEN